MAEINNTNANIGQQNNDSTVNNTFNFSKYEDYEKMTVALKDLEEMLEDIPESKEEKRLQYSHKINQQKEIIEAFKQEVLRLAETFLRREINTERLRQAKAYFDEGKLREADAILKTKDLQQDQDSLLGAKDKKTKELQELEQNLRNNATEFLLKAHLAAINFEDTKRFENAKYYYEKALLSDENYNILNQYAQFLHVLKEYKKTYDYYDRALENIKKTNLGEIKVKFEIFINFAILCLELRQFPESEDLLNQALSLYEQLDQKEQNEYRTAISQPIS